MIEVDEKYLKFFDDAKSENVLEEVIDDDKSVCSAWSDDEVLREDEKERIKKMQEKIDGLQSWINSLDSTDDSSKLLIATFQNAKSEMNKLQSKMGSENRSA